MTIEVFMLHLFRHALRLSPRQLVRQGLRFLGRRVKQRLLGRLLRNHCTYPPQAQVGGPLARRLGPIDPALLGPVAATLRPLARAWRRHAFDVLGSGWTAVAPPPAVPPWRGNRAAAAALAANIDPAYRRIDWQLDIRSGWRWDVRTWGPASPYAHRPGVDIKVPWELGRLQHLPPLALAWALDRDPAVADEARNQMLDFMAANPPGWGVDWACAMDVAIRAVNLLTTLDLFHAHGHAFDRGFEDELGAYLLAHGRHIVAYLEYTGDDRGNHYLANLTGLAFLGALLPRAAETDLWLAFAVQQLQVEIPRQFLPDGGNFEASTAYHRLSLEMALLAVAVVLGLPERRRAALSDYDARQWHHAPALAPAPMAWPPFDGAVGERLARAVRFAADVTKPSGDIVQIGDNDSGRLLKLAPLCDLRPSGPRERGLDVSHLLGAAEGLFGGDFAAPATAALDRAVVAMLAGGHRLPSGDPRPRRLAASAAPLPAARTLTRVTLVPPDPAALADLEAIAYPDFGLFLWTGRRAFVSVRCGPIGQNGRGGHAHNDQLAVEIEIDGTPWVRDPGTWTYTADLAARNLYRSAAAHFVPRFGEAEPARLDLGPFRLEDRAQARALRFTDTTFVGGHVGFGVPVYRRVRIADGALTIEDGIGGLDPAAAAVAHVVRTPAELATLWGLEVPFSPGYGLRD
ncbi:MAG: alginate lyase family protein [Magnetospirillum sp.]|nr:alginate lyase family protein [Magnetospirillum sp.]